MSLFFENEIQKMKDKANSSELLEILSQDPRGSGQIPRENRRTPYGRQNSRNDNSRNRPW